MGQVFLAKLMFFSATMAMMLAQRTECGAAKGLLTFLAVKATVAKVQLTQAEYVLPVLSLTIQPSIHSTWDVC